MKLSQLLKTIDDNRLLKIGSDDGHSYWIVGTPDFIRKNQGDINQAAYEYLCKVLHNAEEELAATLRNPPTLTSYASEKANSCSEPSFSLNEYIKQVEKWFYTIKVRKRSVENRTKALDNRKPIMSREVVEWTESDPAADNGVIRIIVSGTENGKFWTTDEADYKSCVAFKNFTEEQTEQE